MSERTSLVLGASGFVGTALIDALKDRGRRVVGVDLRFSELRKSRCDDFLIGDLREPSYAERLLKRFSIDEVFVLCLLGGPHTADEFRDLLLIHLHLLEAMVREEVLSVVLVFHESAALGIHRDDRAVAWLALESLYQKYARELGMEVRIVRPFQVFGAGASSRTNEMTWLCQQILNEDVVEIDAMASDMLRPLFVKDVCKQILAVQAMQNSQPINLISPCQITYAHWVDKIRNLAHRDVQVLWKGVQPRPNLDRMASLDFEVEVSLDQALQDLIESLELTRTLSLERSPTSEDTARFDFFR